MANSVKDEPGDQPESRPINNQSERGPEKKLYQRPKLEAFGKVHHVT